MFKRSHDQARFIFCQGPLARSENGPSNYSKKGEEGKTPKVAGRETADILPGGSWVGG